MSESELDLDLDELSSAEDFLDYFKIEYNQSIVHVNRLHILQRFHDYLEQVGDMPESDSDRHQIYAAQLKKSYADFENSDAKSEKVFRVFQSMGSAEIMVPLSDLMPGSENNAAKI